MRILIIGASGSGTTTLGRSLARAINAEFLDADDFYWLPTHPPYQRKRPPEMRLQMIVDAASQGGDTVISGSVVDWGEILENSFALIVFLTLAAPIRLERLRIREMAQLGQVDPEFLEWAGQYDEGRMTGRSRQMHETWLATRSCPVLRIDGDLSIDERLARVFAAIRDLA